jgi:CheY-like chemotaxis protein
MEQMPDLRAQKTILVVDDNPEILKFVSELLAASVFKVLTAVNGQDALQQAKAYKSEIHLLLTDFEMPGMSGIDLATKLTLERPKIQVLLMSGFNGGMLVLNEGWHFLARPFIPSQLRALVVGLISPGGKSKF